MTLTFTDTESGRASKAVCDFYGYVGYTLQKEEDRFVGVVRLRHRENLRITVDFSAPSMQGVKAELSYQWRLLTRG